MFAYWLGDVLGFVSLVMGVFEMKGVIEGVLFAYFKSILLGILYCFRFK